MGKIKTPVALFNDTAKAYEDKFMHLDLYDRTYDLFCEKVKIEGADILELGCGPGNITRYLLNKRPDFNLLATDIAPNMLELAQKNNPAARFELVDAKELEKINEKFDGIVCGFCTPYLSMTECEKLVRDSAALLRRHGVFYLSTIEGKAEDSEYLAGSSGDSVFVYYYEEKDLRSMLEKNNFTVTDVIRVPYPGSEKNDMHLVVIAVKA